MNEKTNFKQIKDEIDQIRKTNPTLKDDSAFVLWFLRAYLADSEEIASKSLTGRSSDKGIDAIMVDDKSKQVYIVQGKFHLSLGVYGEKRADVLSFADLGLLPWQEADALKSFYSKLDPLAKSKYEEAVHLLRRKGYQLFLYYITTGRCSDVICREAMDKVRRAEGPVQIFIHDHKQICNIFDDYLKGVAPAVPTLILKITTEGTIQTEGVIHRYDPEKEIESWVFSMSSKDVGEMFNKTGIRLFARNIRGYLGEPNEINMAMADTVEREPHNFWYYNNGVTIVCDDAKREIQAGHDVLRVDRPQVINGQQTTRTLCKSSSHKASVLVKVIRIQRNIGNDEYDDLVSAIVRATNWQNPIKPSDLVSNDYIQVFMEREFRKRGYQYLRKRMTKSEARRLLGSQLYYQIKKEEIAQAVAACEFDPAIVRKGKERLFDERYYRSIFCARAISFYLSRYWLMRQVQSSAYGYPERAYAKWLVLNFAWKLLGNSIASGQAEAKFRYACEYNNKKVVSQLYKLLNDIFKGSLAFYRHNRGKGATAKDVSTFFQLTSLHTKFIKFWGSKNNSYKKAVEIRIDKFKKALSDIDIEL